MSGLVIVEKKVKDFTHLVFISLVDTRILQTMIDPLPGRGISPSKMGRILEGQVDIPWKDVPLAGLRVVIIVNILLRAHVGVVDCEVYRVEIGRAHV